MSTMSEVMMFVLRRKIKKAKKQKIKKSKNQKMKMISEDQRNDKGRWRRNGQKRLSAPWEGELESVAIITKTSHLHPIAV